MNKSGRPKVEKPKNVKYSIRIDEETESKLVKYANEHDITKGEAIRLAINKLLGIKK